jgi:hypothetical protein
MIFEAAAGEPRLDRQAHGLGDLARGGAVARLQVAAHRDADRRRNGGAGLQHGRTRDAVLVVRQATGKRDAGAGRAESGKAGGDEQPGRARIPGIRHDEAARLPVEIMEGLGLGFQVGRHGSPPSVLSTLAKVKRTESKLAGGSAKRQSERRIWTSPPEICDQG